MVATPTLSLDEEFARRCARSLALFQEATRVFPGGITHDVRYLEPFSLYVTRAEGSHKWDADGNELIGYWMGHGALLLGHNHPAVSAAVAEQLGRGTHYGASHAVEIAWAKLVVQLVPSAELVRFTSSGTEATMMALRLARAFTGRTKILKFRGHFHGWHDYAAPGYRPPYELPADLPGLPRETQQTLIVAPPNDIRAVREHLATGEVAGVILEPAGGSNATIPTDLRFLEELRAATRETGTVLIFDEVVTGFRYAPGGAQEYYGVTPDLTTLAKILAGGLPGGAVAGRGAILDLLSFSNPRKIAHAGTYNANPLAAAAGRAALELVATGEPTRRANAAGAELRRALAEVVRRRGVAGRVYGEASVIHWHLGEEVPDLSDPTAPHYQPALERLLSGMGKLRLALRKALILNGVDCPGAQMMTSAVHSTEDLERTVGAFDAALERLQRERLL